MKKWKFSCYHCLIDATYISFTMHQPGTEHYPLFTLGLISFLWPGEGGGGGLGGLGGAGTGGPPI